MVVRCTRKLFDLIGADAAALIEVAPADHDWYGNLLWLDRRKCLLLAHAGTLFSVFRADIRKAELPPLGRYLVDAVEAELRDEGLPPDVFGPLESEHVRLAKTASRSTLGVMNEMAFQIRYQVEHAGGPDRCDVRVVNRRLRRTLHSRAGDYVEPLDLVAKWR